MLANLDAQGRGGVDIAGDRQLPMPVRPEDGLQIGLQGRAVRQGRRHGIGVSLQNAVGENLDRLGADQIRARIFGAHGLGLGDDGVIVDAAIGRAEGFRIVELHQVDAGVQRALGDQPVIEGQHLGHHIGVLDGGDAVAAQALGHQFRGLHQGGQVDDQHVRRPKGVAGVFIGRAVGLARRIHPYQLAKIGEVRRQRRAAIADDLALGVAGLGQSQAVEGAMVAVIAQKRDGIVRRGPVEGGAEGGGSGARLIARGEVPLLHRQPFAGLDVEALDAVLNKGDQTIQADGLGIEVAGRDLGYAQGMDVGVHQARQHQPAAGILDLGPGADQGLDRGRIADRDYLALGDRHRLGDRMLSILCVDPGVQHHQIRPVGGARLWGARSLGAEGRGEGGEGCACEQGGDLGELHGASFRFWRAACLGLISIYRRR